MLKRTEIEIGDIFHVLTSVGVIYGQVTHKHNDYGCVIIVFKYAFPKKPKDYNTVTAQPIQLITTFDLQKAVNRGLMSLIANVPVVDKYQKFPTFRFETGAETAFWNGEKQWNVSRSLTDEEKTYPVGPLRLSPVELVRIIKANYDPNDPVNKQFGF
jgi:hypothetical protein